MNDQEYTALLELIMCADPWPASDKAHTLILDFANREAMRRGMADWIVAYHAFSL